MTGDGESTDGEFRRDGEMIQPAPGTPLSETLLANEAGLEEAEDGADVVGLITATDALEAVMGEMEDPLEG